jgi:DNA-binding CsgD family transcriptional regulator
MRPPSDSDLLDYIGAIYDCIIDPGKWEPALLRIAVDLGFVNAIISAVTVDTGETLVTVAAGVAPSFRATAHQYGDGIVRMWGGPERILSLPQREPVIQSQASDRGTWDSIDLYAKWMAPQGIHDTVAVGLNRDGIIANIAFGRHVSAGPVSEEQLDALRVLAPHFARALEIMRLVDQSDAETAMAATLIDRAKSPVFLIDAESKIAFANAAAKTMIGNGDAEQTPGGGLKIPMAIESKTALDRTIQAALDHTLAVSGVVGIPARRRDGAPIIAYVIPIHPGPLRSGLSTTTAAAIFIADPGAASEMRGHVAELLYDLTPAEVRVMELAAEGMAMPRVARALGVSVATARTHLQRVFEKTGCHRQSDLVDLAATLRPPV